MSFFKPRSKISDPRNLKSWINCEISFELTTGEKLVGKLQSIDPKYNVFHFKNLKQLDGTPWCLEQNYSYRDFQGKFVCITKNVTIDINDDFVVRQAAEALLRSLKDKSAILEVVENHEDFEVNEDSKVEIVNVPDAVECEFESIDFDFILDPEVFEGLSNDVVRIDPWDAGKTSEAIAILESNSIVGFTCLPWTDDRDTPIDFAIFGCEKGTFIFPFVHDVWKQLKTILESEEICKVTHNCCVMAARLYKLYHIDLNNVDDTLVWDYVVVRDRDRERAEERKKYGKSKQVAKSYHECVSEYLQIDLPWADTENFYERCGKGKLLTKPLDETGASYARSLVMLYFEMRTELLKHLFFPILEKQFNYLNNVKYISATEYASLKSYGCFSPDHLFQGEAVENAEVNFSAIQTASEILREKYQFYNVVHSRAKLDVGLQCKLETQTRPHYVPRFRNKALASENSTCSKLISRNGYDGSQPGSSRSSTISSNPSSSSQSPLISHYKNNTHVTHGNNSSAMNAHHGLIHEKDNHDSPLNQSTNQPEHSQNNMNHVNTHDSTPDWEKIANRIPDRPVTARLYPAGLNMNF